MAAQEEIEVRFVDEFTDEEIIELWRMYDESFREVNENNPCRQSFYEDEFRIALLDPEVKKLGAFVAGRMVAMAIWSRKLPLFPWISQDYYRVHHPKEYAAGEVTYIMALLARPEDHRKGYGSACAEGTVMDILEHGGLAVMDMCEDNAWLPGVVRDQFQEFASVGLQLITYETYWEMRITSKD